MTRPARSAALAASATALIVFLAAPAALAQEPESPTGPIALPGAGIVLDPLAPGEPEQQLEIQQPNASLMPFFQDATGWFGQGFVDADGSPRASVTVGADRVLVMSDITDKVFLYDTRSLAAVAPGSFSTGFASSRNITFYRGEIYVLGGSSSTGSSTIRVFDLNGGLRRSMPLNSVGTSGTFTGLDVAWGEIWVSTASQSSSTGDITGHQVAVFDATNGAFKGVGRQPLGDRDQDEPNRYWWDFALSPELGGGISDRRFFGRGAWPLTGFGTDDALACTGRVLFGCVANNQRGIDAVWGMRWFLELNSPVVNNYDRQVTEYSIDKRKAVSQPALGLSLDYPGYYLSYRRSWSPRQATQQTALTLTDVVYSHRKARIDWSGPPTTDAWLRGTQRVNYVVSDADIFVIGARGERWYEPARGFQRIQLWINDQFIEEKTSAVGYFDVPTTQYANRPGVGEEPHKLELRATLEGNRELVSTNPSMRVDNLPPTGTIASVGEFVSGTVRVSGTPSDAHSGPKSWELEMQSPGGAWQRICGPLTEPDATGSYTCSWNTATVADGRYNLRGRVTDYASDGGNIGYTPVISTFVDNTDPTLSVSGGLTERADAALPIFEDEQPPLATASADVGGSGVARIEVFVDGLKVDGAEQACAGCPLDQTFSFDPTRHETGDHTVRVVATDQAGRSRETSWTTEIWRNPPDTPDESDADQFDSEGADAAATSNTRSMPSLGVAAGAASEARPDVVETRGGSAIRELPPLECDDDDPYLVYDHLDYPAPENLDLMLGTPNPDVAVAGYLHSATNLPLIPPSVFKEEITTDLERFYSVHIDDDRRAWVLLSLTETGGWRGNYFGACSEFVDAYMWMSAPSLETLR